MHFFSSRNLPGIPANEKVVVYKMVINDHMVYGRLYKRVKKRMSCAVKFQDDNGEKNFGIVQLFAIHEGIPVAIITALTFSEDQINEECDFGRLEVYSVQSVISHITKIEAPDGKLLTLPATSIIEKVVFMRVPDSSGDKYYISEFPNFIECD